MGLFDPNAIGGAPITDYIQTGVLLTSQRVEVPPGTKRIEALGCGGGGGGGTTNAGGGGFGGASICEIPLTGFPLDLVIGAGGMPGNIGGTTSVSSGGTLYAAWGGGGHGNGGNGRYSGGGGGSTGGGAGGAGGPPFRPNYLWSAAEACTLNSLYVPGRMYASATAFIPFAPGSGAVASGIGGVNAAMGYGGGGGGGGDVNGSGGGGYPGPNCDFGGGGGGYGRAGTSLTSVSMWGLTGFAGGALATAGGGGGGLLAAGTAASGTTGGNGGLGGGGGGAGTVPGTAGAGLVVLRFYF